MKKLVDFFIDRPILVKVIIATIFLLGVKTVRDIPKEGFPNISFNTIIISTIYPGAAARDVEQNVTIPLEDELLELARIEEITSLSREGLSTITIKADDDASAAEFFELYGEVDTALNRVKDLPSDIDGRPSIASITSEDLAVVELAVTGPQEQLQKVVPCLERVIKEISSVAAVEKIGFPDEEMHILVDPMEALRNYVDLPMIAQAIATRNVEITGGTLELSSGEKKVVSLNKYQGNQEVLNTNIRLNTDGTGVKLKDVAQLKAGVEDIGLAVRSFGQRGVTLAITKKAGSDIIKTVAAVEEKISSLNLPDNVNVRIIADRSTMTKSRLSLVVSNAIIGFVLVVIVLLIFFNLRTSFWTAFGIPFSLAGAYALFPLFNMTLDLMSLGGFIVVLGLMVDDAIVVSEQISFYKEKGYAGKEASGLAIERIWRAVLAGVVTTILAFSPMFSVGGLPGKFIWELPFVVIVILMISLFDAYFLLPVHLCTDQRDKTEKKKFIIKLENWYREVLQRILKYRGWVVVFFVMLLFGALLAAKSIKKDSFPQEAAEGFNIQMVLPVGSPLVETEQRVVQMEKIIERLPKHELFGYSSRVGTNNTSNFLQRGTQNNLAAILVNLTPYAKRQRTAQEIIEWVRSQGTQIDGVEMSYQLQRVGPPLGYAFEINVIGNSDTARETTVEKMMSYLRTVKGVSDIESSEVKGKEEYNIRINYDALERASLTVQDVALTLRTAFDGKIVTKVVREDKTVDYRLRLHEKARRDLNFIKSLPLLNRKGQLINLDKMVTVEILPAKGEIARLNGQRVTTVFGNVDRAFVSPDDVVKLIQKNFKSNETITISFAGESKESAKIFGDLLVALLVALGGIYLSLALTFNSFKTPVLVMAIIPFGLIGIVLAVFLHGMSLSVFAMLAVIGLTGVIVNDAIVMVDRIRELEKETAFSLATVVDGAVSRLRAIILTTLTTVLALLPTGYGIGGYDPFLSHMCLALSYGLMFGTVILLLLLPCFYALVGKYLR